MRVWYLLALLLDALAVPAQVYVSSCLGAGDRPGRAPHAAARPGRRDGAGRRYRRAGVLRARPVHRGRRRAARRDAGPGGGGRHPAAGRAGVRPRRPHPRPVGLCRDAPRDDPRLARVRPVAALVLEFPRLGLPGVWAALGIWLAARAAPLGRRWHGVLPPAPACRAAGNAHVGQNSLKAPSGYELEGAFGGQKALLSERAVVLPPAPARPGPAVPGAGGARSRPCLPATAGTTRYLLRAAAVRIAGRPSLPVRSPCRGELPVETMCAPCGAAPPAQHICVLRWTCRLNVPRSSVVGAPVGDRHSTSNSW
jgi:hypothetical protein